MKVAVVYQYYQAHDAPGHSLVYELSRYLADRGHKVTVIAGETGYMRRDVSRLRWYQRLLRRERDNSVDVVRTYTYSELHRSYMGRLLSFISFAVTCPLGLISIEKPDVVLASSPPIFPVFSAWLVCKLRRIPFVTEVRDLWPASAVQIGVVQNKQLIRVMAWMEKTLYNHSSKIVALTEGIRTDICDRGWPREKVKLVTCGVDQETLYPDFEAADMIRNHQGWKDKKIVLYFGALGEANNIPVIIRAAERLRERLDIVFVLVGDGMYRKATEEQRSAKKLDNLLILPPVPKEQARSFISAADLCLVTLRDIPLFSGAIPTKLIDYMACGKPVLCGVRGEAQRIVEGAGVGAVFDPDDDARLSGLVLEFLADPDHAARVGARGVEFVRKRFSAPTMRRHMEDILLSLVDESLHTRESRETGT